MPFCKYCKNSTATYSKRLHTFVVGCTYTSNHCCFIPRGKKNENDKKHELPPVSDMVQHESTVLQAKPQQVQSIWRQGD